jgi:hypothetical protein
LREKNQMNLHSRYSVILVGLLLAVAAACNQPNNDDPGKEKGNSPASTATEIEADEIVEMLTQGAKLYWGINALRTAETTTLDGTQMVGLDPAALPSLQALRQRFAGLFTERAIGLLVADLGVKESGGKLWIPAADPDDISLYEDADVTQSVPNGDTVMVTVDVPLGDSGQSDLRGVRLVHKAGAWRIDNNPFSGDVEEGESEGN